MSGREAGSSSARPYRSKRHRPCDSCRRRKQACCLEGQPPCRLCVELRIACTFNDPPSKRRRTGTQQPSPLTCSLESNDSDIVEGFEATDCDLDAASDGGHGSTNDAPWEFTHMATSGDVSNVTIDLGPDPQVSDTHDGNLDGRLMPSHDMWYLASLWDVNQSGSMMHPTAAVGEVEANENEIGLLNFSTRSPVLPSPRQSATQPAGNTSISAETALYYTTSHSYPARVPVPLQQDKTTNYLSPSSDLDPYLLQHMRFPADGISNFKHFQYRVLASKATTSSAQQRSSEHSPAYFIVNKRTTLENGDDMNAPKPDSSLNLEDLVNPQVGSCLVGLFLRYVFPGLPILSRSRLTLKTKTLLPRPETLKILPSHLLAAIYASADQFRRYDPFLCASPERNTGLVDHLWRIAYDGIQQNLHKPQLDLLQTILLYLQHTGRRDEAAAANKTAEWSLTGSAINIAYQLGLHIDCTDWSIPTWEQRLRRRLWWVTYSEASWRTLLQGFPQTISPDQWDVRPLDENDFFIDSIRIPSEESSTRVPALQEPCQFCHLGYDFRFVADLSHHASNLHCRMYTMAAIRKCSGNFKETLGIGSSLLADLQRWKKDLPSHITTHSLSNIRENRDYFHPGSATNIKMAYLTIEVLIYRAILRSLPSKLTANEIDPPPEQRHDGDTPNGQAPGSVLETYRAAINVMQRISGFVERLGSYDRNSLYYAWTEECFSIMSNFILFLLVRAPTAEIAKDVLALLARWVILLREQCILFDQTRLALTRLDTVFHMGMENVFHFSPHVKKAVEDEFPMRLYKN
ncbi:hypothetical protein PFICI_04544 [Pestalotiopsis fici W106-1]|uniref:Zn(2)-C6 fungal-type domain-containing protein n=1 Tax=Pestalotiopsis fici (strain W106-1 / CGMCC3.15140) TaxID=1229662 RepID=W3X973_PESFW|nr:uncharacterized protein PFICI_04544 [Pestalotiopsis fici W106-1]ETS82668.1 hypothetical protein PFICI_04544 [Pestalotiopsis fici W106-1]